MSNIDLSTFVGGDITGFSSTEVDILDDAGDTAVILGTGFSAFPPGGTVHSLTVRDSGNHVLFAATGLNLDLAPIYAHRHDAAALMNDLFGGANSIRSFATNDVLTGLAGDDVLNGGLGDDTLDGGADNDTASYVGLATGVTVNLGHAGAQNTIGGGTDTLISIENLLGTNHDDNLSGDGGANILNGSGGDDTLNGGGGDDVLYGGPGSDTLNGGTGNDTASYANALGAITISLATVGAQVTGGAGVDTLSSMENLVGSAFNDDLMGSSVANTINGGLGNDTIRGVDGDDILQGGGGNDTITGGLGRDTLRGDAGNDVFKFNAITESSVTLPDRIADFTTGDRINLHAIDADTTTAGNQDFHIGGGGGHAGDLVVTYDSVHDRTVLSLYVNNDATVDSNIWLTGNHALGAADLIL